jgi:hypothetical protein
MVRADGTVAGWRVSSSSRRMATAPTSPRTLSAARWRRSSTISSSSIAGVLRAWRRGADERSVQSIASRRVLPARSTQRWTVSRLTPKRRAVARRETPARTLPTMSRRTCSARASAELFGPRRHLRIRFCRAYRLGGDVTTRLGGAVTRPSFRKLHGSHRRRPKAGRRRVAGGPRTRLVLGSSRGGGGRPAVTAPLERPRRRHPR